MGFDTWRQGELTISPPNAFTLPDRDYSRLEDDSPLDFMYLLADDADTVTLEDGQLWFDGWARWYDDEFNDALARWLDYCYANGITVQGRINSECDEGGHEEWVIEVDTTKSPIWKIISSNIIYEDDWRLTLVKLTVEAVKEWREHGGLKVGHLRAFVKAAEALIPDRELTKKGQD